MLFFRCDYSEGAHPVIMDALIKTNMEQTLGYGEDDYCQSAAQLIKSKIKKSDAEVHFFVGGTQTNFTSISAFLRPYEAVISSSRGHICVHETGAVEATGHKILALPTKDAKLHPEQIEETVLYHCDEHMVKPKMVYISNSTELGTIYNKADLIAISNMCKKYNLYLYVDGARLGSALMSQGNDLTLADLAQLADAFYIGGTKNGALFGEALVICNLDLQNDFRYVLKQKGGLLAKGRLLGVQFQALFENDLYFQMAAHANRMAELLVEGISELGFRFLTDSPTNQIFPIFPINIVTELREICSFEDEGPIGDTEFCIRFVTSWATPESDVVALLDKLKDISA